MLAKLRSYRQSFRRRLSQSMPGLLRSTYVDGGHVLGMSYFADVPDPGAAHFIPASSATRCIRYSPL